MQIKSLKNYFLIATPSLDGGMFKSSVTYICEHNEEGAMGIIINRPSKLTVGEVLEEYDKAEEAFKSAPVLLGGPVGMQRGFVLHNGVGASVSNKLSDKAAQGVECADCVVDDDLGVDGALTESVGAPAAWESSMPVGSDIYLTGSKDILRALSKANGPENYLLTLGYAGWEGGQLEQEIIDNHWLAVPAKADVLFDTPIDERFDKALGLLGIDRMSLASMGGNA